MEFPPGYVRRLEPIIRSQPQKGRSPGLDPFPIVPKIGASRCPRQPDSLPDEERISWKPIRFRPRPKSYSI